MPVTPGLQRVDKDKIEIAMQASMLEPVVQQQYVTVKFRDRLSC